MKLLNLINKKADLLSHINPDRFYVEEVRSIFNLTTGIARFYCNMAVKQHFFEKNIAIICPQCGKVMKTIKRYSEMPEIIECDTCMGLEKDVYEFNISKKDTMEFYKLVK